MNQSHVTSLERLVGIAVSQAMLDTLGLEKSRDGGFTEVWL